MSEVQPSGSLFVRRWWPVLAALVLVLVFPLAGILFAAVMAFTQRRDRPLTYWLLGIALVCLLWFLVFAVTGGVGVDTPGLTG